MKNASRVLGTAQIILVAVGFTVTILLYRSTMLYLVSIFAFNVLATIFSFASFICSVKQPSRLSLISEALLFCSLVLNCYFVHTDNLAYVLFNESALEYGYYALLGVMLLLTIIFEVLYLKALKLSLLQKNK